MSRLDNDCPVCGNGISVKCDYEVGENVTCPTCNSGFEIIWANPFTVVETSYEEDFLYD